MNESEQRAKVVEMALSYQGTPYHACGRVKGPHGGVDCLTFIVGTYEDTGMIPKQKLPSYSALWHLHNQEEKYVAAITQFCTEYNRKDDEWRDPKPGDLLLYKIGRCFSHGIIVISWPHSAIHSRYMRNVFLTDPVIDGDLCGRPIRYFTFWKIA